MLYFFLISQVCTATDVNSGIGFLPCPNDCTHPTQGTCNIITGVCTCEEGYKGNNCAGKSNQIWNQYCPAL